MKIYVASSWRNNHQPLVVEMLRSIGHEVYDFKNPPTGTGFAWSSIDPNWQSWSPVKYLEALRHPLSEAGFKSDFDAMKWADCCVMVLPCGRSANTEAGWMKGAGKTVYVYQPIAQEPELMYKIYDDVIISMEQLKTTLDSSNDPKEKYFNYAKKAVREKYYEEWMGEDDWQSLENFFALKGLSYEEISLKIYEGIAGGGTLEIQSKAILEVMGTLKHRWTPFI